MMSDVQVGVGGRRAALTPQFLAAAATHSIEYRTALRGDLRELVHDVRGCLTGIVGHASLLSANDDPTRRRTWIARIQESADRLQAATAKLTSAARQGPNTRRSATACIPAERFESAVAKCTVEEPGIASSITIDIDADLNRPWGCDEDRVDHAVIVMAWLLGDGLVGSTWQIGLDDSLMAFAAQSERSDSDAVIVQLAVTGAVEQPPTSTGPSLDLDTIRHVGRLFDRTIEVDQSDGHVQYRCQLPIYPIEIPELP